MNNKAIVKQIRATLEKDNRINLHRYPITIATQDGDVILAGEVEKP
jgi:osmotically-inducible protein OsmY